MEELHRKHKTHRNVLYVLAFLLLLLQTISFVTLSSQVSRVHSDIERAQIELRANLTKDFNSKIEKSETQSQQNFNDIARTFQDVSQKINKQEATFNQEIKLLKSSQDDFSGIIQDLVKGVVSVGTDKAMGSGFVVYSNASVSLLVTNYHVISGAREVRVLFYDSTVLPATVFAVDSVRDIAVLRVDRPSQALSLADSDNLQVGKKVIAIGNPLGLSFTVTEGIISAVHRKGPNDLSEYVQTDVSLNPGNSGGPLIDTAGKVIGVNNFKVGNAENIGFALESNALRNVVNQLVGKTLL